MRYQLRKGEKLPIEREFYLASQPDPSAELMQCPACDEPAPVNASSCPACGFPFVSGLAGAEEIPASSRLAPWRLLTLFLGIAFVITSGIYFIPGYQEYQGLTYEVVSTLQPIKTSGIPINGPDQFIWRTEMALALLEMRAPEYYWRIQDSVASITYLKHHYIDTEHGRLYLEGIGALATPANNAVYVLDVTAFPSGVGDYFDRDVFTYAGVLVHELRHIELHSMGQAPGGWKEEVICEQAAYDALSNTDAPIAVLARYESYLRQPTARRYQSWYEWYEQFE